MSKPSDNDVLVVPVESLRIAASGQVELIAETSGDKLQSSSLETLVLQPGGQELFAVRGCAFRRGDHFAVDPVPWTEIASQLAESNWDEDACAGIAASLHGAFWFVRVAFKGQSDELSVHAASDPIGRIPMWSGKGGPESWVFSTRKDCTFVHNMRGLRLHSPRLLLFWNLTRGFTSSGPMPFYALHATKSFSAPCRTDDRPEQAADLESAVLRAIERCVPKGMERVGILFSGGLDSGLLAHLVSGSSCRCTCYTAGFHVAERAFPEDLDASKVAAAALGLEWHAEIADLDSAEKLLTDCAPIVQDWNSVKSGVAMTFLAACRLAASRGERVVLSGLGSEEVFAGYQRHAAACKDGAEATAKDRALGLAQMYHRDLQRDFALASLAGVEIRYPYLDGDLIEKGLSLPAAFEERDVGAAPHLAADGVKGALRVVAMRTGAPELIYARRKRAAQYGSRFHQALVLLSKRWALNGDLREGPAKFRMANLVMSVPGASHGPMAILYTSGLDSAQAFVAHRSAHVPIACIIPPASDGIQGSFWDSARQAAQRFALAAGVPLLAHSAKFKRVAGFERYDQDSLLHAFAAARDEYGAEGVSCGHVTDVSRWHAVAEAADCTGLRAYGPMWGGTRSDPSLHRLVGDDCSLAVTRFPGGSMVGQRVQNAADADVVLAVLNATATCESTGRGIGRPVDADTGIFDCEVTACSFFSSACAEESVARISFESGSEAMSQ